MTDYLRWHYNSILTKVITLWRNLSIYPLYYFAVPQHLATLAVPWKRQTRRHRPGLILESILTVIFFNLTAVTIGLLARIVVISAAVTLVPVMFVSGLALVIVWLFIPFLTLPFYLSGKHKLDTAPARLQLKFSGNLKNLAIGLLQSDHGRFCVRRIGLSPNMLLSIVKRTNDSGN